MDDRGIPGLILEAEKKEQVAVVELKEGGSTWMANGPVGELFVALDCLVNYCMSEINSDEDVAVVERAMDILVPLAKRDLSQL